jgi:hypothetical protein
MNAKSSFKIWVLLEFGVKESWTKVTTTGLPMDLERYEYLTEFPEFAMFKHGYSRNFDKI